MHDVSFELNNVSTRYQMWNGTSFVFGPASVTLPPRGWVLITGHNGSGKTTLLNLLAGRITPAAGTIALFGKPLSRYSRTGLAKEISYVTQKLDDSLVPSFTLNDHVRASGTGWKDFVARISEMGGENAFSFLRTLGSHPIETLSGGEKQMFALGFHLLRPTQVALLDEPFSSLDPGRVQSLIRVLGKLKSGKCIVQISHEPEILRPYVDMEIRVSSGRIEVLSKNQ